MNSRNPAKSFPRPEDSMADVIAVYKRDVDRSLLRSRLKRTPEERLLDVMEAQKVAEEFRRAGREARNRG